MFNIKYLFFAEKIKIKEKLIGLNNMYLWRPKSGLISFYRSSNDIEEIKIYIVDLCEKLKVDIIVGKWIYNNPDADVIVVKFKNEYNEVQFLGNICRVKDI